MSRSEIESYLLSSVAASFRRLTFIDLVRSARRDLCVERTAVAAAVKRLLADGSLAYVQAIGTNVFRDFLPSRPQDLHENYLDPGHGSSVDRQECRRY